MKRNLAIKAVLLTIVLLSGCSTTSGDQKPAEKPQITDTAPNADGKPSIEEVRSRLVNDGVSQGLTSAQAFIFADCAAPKFYDGLSADSLAAFIDEGLGTHVASADAATGNAIIKECAKAVTGGSAPETAAPSFSAAGGATITWTDSKTGWVTVFEVGIGALSPATLKEAQDLCPVAAKYYAQNPARKFLVAKVQGTVTFPTVGGLTPPPGRGGAVYFGGNMPATGDFSGLFACAEGTNNQTGFSGGLPVDSSKADAPQPFEFALIKYGDPSPNHPDGDFGDIQNHFAGIWWGFTTGAEYTSTCTIEVSGIAQPLGGMDPDCRFKVGQ